jgi:glycosyltransferase involved in cell wall biosynthesis
MRIGVYLVGLNPTYVGGLTTYAVGLLNGLISNHRGNQIVTFVSDDAQLFLADRVKTAPHASFVALNEPSKSAVERLTLLPALSIFHKHVRNRRMRRVSDQISAECDVILFPLCYMATYQLRVPSIVSFHDLQHEAYPQFFGWRSLRARRVFFDNTFRHASLMQASSIAMKNDALRVYRSFLAPERVAVIPEGVDYSVFSGSSDEDARKTFGLPGEFMFYPAQLWHHKNHLRLIEAIDVVRRREGIEIPLVLTGAEYEAAPAIRDMIAERGLGDLIFLLGKVPFPSLLSLYRQASYVVSASLHESNCLPVLEAAASGSPMIVSDIPANRESAEVFQLRLFEPLNVESIVTAVSEAWRHRHANQEAIDANREAARKIDWTMIAGMYLDQAERLVNASHPRRGLRHAASTR